MRIAVFALQGAFVEHEHMLQQLGADTFQVRQAADWNQHKDGIILPGGESTVQSKLLQELGLFEPLRQAISEGLPVFGTCAGLILLSPSHLGTMDIEVRRNAYGRQLGSFHTNASVSHVGTDIPMTFIRAPYIEKVTSPDCEVLSEVDGHIVAARQGNQLVTAFHPELDNDLRIHEFFLSIARK
ncbi:MAG: pyridoxal 5'-phosphate synthase glutaminase subunit PdxT [Paludibacteraceae bacterium]|nr:pyridoxal 5'-phosphate synthase glutaminase subunit PdxT [Paludibacteraceae bacterium]